MLQCKYGCSRQFKTKAAMDDHRNASHPGPLPEPMASKRIPVAACNDCAKTFTSVDALRQHQLSKTNHTRLSSGIGSLGCDKCSRTLRSNEALEQHFVADHSLTLLAEAEGDRLRVKLEAEFRENWRKPSRPGRVLSVFKVYNPGWRTLEYERYRKEKRLASSGNQVQRYHGTTLLCDLGSNSQNSKFSKLCQNDGCNLCSILRTGFKKAKARDNWQRFGKGIYTTATSSKSDDYIRSSSSRRAVLVCRVLAGNVYRTLTNIPTLECPPSGYNSVSGEVGQDLNYDETVVYDSKAILPDYMIVYTTTKEKWCDSYFFILSVLLAVFNQLLVDNSFQTERMGSMTDFTLAFLLSRSCAGLDYIRAVGGLECGQCTTNVLDADFDFF